MGKFKPENATPEQIQRDIEIAMSGEDPKSIDKGHMSRIFTFILLFAFYIWLCIYIENYVIKIVTIFSGIIILVVLLQIYVVSPKVISDNKRRTEL